MKTLTVKLKQHTPLIHFQHNQYCATLRASEVKPKLDRFILSKLGNGDYKKGCDEAKKNKWLIGKGEHNALNYKIKIITPDYKREEYLIASYLSETKALPSLNKQNISYISPSPYFAQEKENGEIVKGKRKWDDIKCKGIKNKVINVKIFSLTDSMIDFISQFIQSFFVCENFGTRQSKGFGSFTVVEIELNGKSVPLKEDIELLKNNFTFVYYKDEKSKCLDGIFRTINSDYRLIKSGATFPNYKKSKIMLWADKNGIGWDKKYIKSQFDNVGCPYILKSSNPRQSFSEKDKYLYFRALLGLAEQFEFLLDNPPLGDSKNKLIVKVVNSEIKRYQSPLLFKVIGHRIYLVGNNVSKDILNKSFNFSASIMEDKQWDNFSLGALSTPSSSFKLKDFIEYAMMDKSLGYIRLK